MRVKNIINKLLKGLAKRFTPKTPTASKSKVERPQPLHIPRSEHTISRKHINPNALKVLNRLHEAGYEAFLVGGCVRDLLLGKQPKDFDVATNAHPPEIRKLFRNCRLIGRRFRLAHILFGREIIEVATFRGHDEGNTELHAHTSKGMITRDNVYGTLEEDAFRRDFTINALYYNIADFSVIDFVGGIQDLKERQVRMIGDPEKRYLEDPVRLLRAVRFAGKLDLKISHETESPILHHSHLLQHVSSSRLFQEVLKFFQEGASNTTFPLLQKYHLFQQLFSQTAATLHHPEANKLIHTALSHTDQRIREGKPISPAFLFAVFLWPTISQQMKKLGKRQIHQSEMDTIIHHVIKKQKEQLDIPKRLQFSIREICLLQYRFLKRRGKQPARLLQHPRFRAAFDLLMLRCECGEPIQELCTWWEKFILAPPTEHETEGTSLKHILPHES